MSQQGLWYPLRIGTPEIASILTSVTKDEKAIIWKSKGLGSSLNFAISNIVIVIFCMKHHSCRKCIKYRGTFWMHNYIANPHEISTPPRGDRAHPGNSLRAPLGPQPPSQPPEETAVLAHKELHSSLPTALTHSFPQSLLVPLSSSTLSGP